MQIKKEDVLTELLDFYMIRIVRRLVCVWVQLNKYIRG